MSDSPETGSAVEAAVLIVSHNSRADLGDCLDSVLRSDDAPVARHVVVIDNASADGSADYVERRFPGVDLIRLPANTGFTGGNNRGWEHVRCRYPATRYLALLNPDTIATSGWLRRLVDHLDQHGDLGTVQSKLLMHPQTERVNSAGNRYHFLGFGFVTACGEVDGDAFSRPRPIDYASGAAMAVRTDLVHTFGLFDDSLFMYGDDTELGWKCRQLGFGSALVPASVVYHKYKPAPYSRLYYYFERNRLWLVAVYYKLPTLLLLLPAALAAEAGQMLFAFRLGLAAEKLRAYRFFLRRESLARLSCERQRAQRRRTVGDRQFVAGFAGAMEFVGMEPSLLACAGNRLLDLYWRVARHLIFW